MIQNFKINTKNFNSISSEEKKFREKNLQIFNKDGFPNKRQEDWKFTDLNKIINENFKKLIADSSKENKPTIKMIEDFEHNSIFLVNFYNILCLQL